MSNKQGLSIIAGLILLNIVTVLYFVVGSEKKEHKIETVASVGNKEITRTDWIDELETLHGKDILETMINEEVILQMAKKHQLTVSEDELRAESIIRQALYGMKGTSLTYKSDDKNEKELKVSILLEKLLTEDVVITDQEAELYYENNESLQNMADLYHLSYILVEEEDAVKSIIKELKTGANFADVAVEYSLDKYPADTGGDLGYISLSSEILPAGYKAAVRTLSTGEWSQPIKVKDGYAILYLDDYTRKSELSFNKIKPILKRKAAMEQMDKPVSAEVFWNKVNIDWIYGK